jgi:hypothetical protein
MRSHCSLCLRKTASWRIFFHTSKELQPMRLKKLMRVQHPSVVCEELGSAATTVMRAVGVCSTGWVSNATTVVATTLTKCL